MSTITHTIKPLRSNQLILKIIHILTQWSCRTLMIKIQDIFANRNTPSWSEEVFVVKKVKNTVP